MRNQRLVQCSAMLFLALAPAVGAWAGDATDDLRPEMEQVIATIENPALRTSSMAATRREALVQKIRSRLS